MGKGGPEVASSKPIPQFLYSEAVTSSQVRTAENRHRLGKAAVCRMLGFNGAASDLTHLHPLTDLTLPQANRWKLPTPPFLGERRGRIVPTRLTHTADAGSAGQPGSVLERAGCSPESEHRLRGRTKPGPGHSSKPFRRGLRGPARPCWAPLTS